VTTKKRELKISRAWQAICCHGKLSHRCRLLKEKRGRERNQNLICLFKKRHLFSIYIVFMELLVIFWGESISFKKGCKRLTKTVSLKKGKIDAKIVR
jgi:hypothetical protein